MAVPGPSLGTDLSLYCTVWVMNSFFVYASWLRTIPRLRIPHKDSARYSQMSVLGGRRIRGRVWMAYIKYVAANSKTSPAGLKHLCWGQPFTLATINQVPNAFSLKEKIHRHAHVTRAYYMLVRSALLGRKDILSKNWDWQGQFTWKNQEQGLGEPEKADKSDSQVLGHSLLAFSGSCHSRFFEHTSGRW